MFTIFEIYDSKAETFSPPYTAPTVAVGSRMFAAEANNPTSTISQFPSDFTLFEVGTIDNGVWALHPAKINHGMALGHKRPSNRTNEMIDSQYPPNNGAISPTLTEAS